VGEGCNGEYRPNGTHNERIKYKMINGTAIVYYNQGAWRMNDEDITSGWFYQVNSDALYPPEGAWTTEGYDSADANPPPLVEHSPAPPEAPPILDWSDCAVGEQVRVFPADIAEEPTRNSAAHWTRSCAEHAGQVATIVTVDEDNTLQLRFDDGALLWFAVGSCTKTLVAPEPEHQNVEIWVTGAGGRGVSLNGRYAKVGLHRGRPVIYFNNDWKMSPSSLTGWFYSVVGNFTLPPDGPWTTHGYGSRDVLPAPHVHLCRPYIFTLTEAGGIAEDTNGEYRQVDILNDRPKYKQIDGTSIIYWVNGFWRINYRDCTAGWYYCVRSDEPYPPEGQWTLEGYNSGNASPIPLVSRRELRPEDVLPPSPSGRAMRSTADCRVGDRVQVLPIELAEQPTRDSAATWTEACAAKCGQEGTIVHVDRDQTIRVRFEDGRHLWLSVRSCALVQVHTPVSWRVHVRGAGGRGARLNGPYEQDGEHNGRPLYRQIVPDVRPKGVIYYGEDNAWRISPGSLGGWFYGIQTEANNPPEGQWGTHGFTGGDVLPAPMVELERLDDIPSPPRPRPQRRFDRDTEAASSSDGSDNDSRTAPRTVPDNIEVHGAGGAMGSRLNGFYRRCGTFKGRPKYRQITGEAIVYFQKRWKINGQDDVTSWVYSVPSYEPCPPPGLWTTEGYDDGDADPAPQLVYCATELTEATVQRRPIVRREDCAVGERVRILPAIVAELAARDSAATWHEECEAHCEEVGEIVAVDSDDTIRVAFDNGDLFWYALGCCTKDLD
jgi:hypothetical protein